MILTEPKTASLITSLNTGNYSGVIKALESDLAFAVAKSVPTRQLINSGAKEPHLVATLAMLVTKYAEMLSVGGNLKAGHEIEIAKMLIEEYPTASLDDFQIMLSRGVRGRYGEIFRFDVAVIFGWMAAYMEEWAEEKERQLAKERGQQKTTIEEIKEVEPEKVDAMLNELLDKLKDNREGMKSMPQLTPKEIREDGQSAPPRKKAAASAQFLTTAEQAELKARRTQWMKECFDLITGKPNDRHLDFETWLAQLGEVKQ